MTFKRNSRGQLYCRRCGQWAANGHTCDAATLSPQDRHRRGMEALAMAQELLGADPAPVDTGERRWTMVSHGEGVHFELAQGEAPLDVTIYPRQEGDDGTYGQFRWEVRNRPEDGGDVIDSGWSPDANSAMRSANEFMFGDAEAADLDFTGSNDPAPESFGTAGSFGGLPVAHDSIDDDGDFDLGYHERHYDGREDDGWVEPDSACGYCGAVHSDLALCEPSDLRPEQVETDLTGTAAPAAERTPPPLEDMVYGTPEPFDNVPPSLPPVLTARFDRFEDARTSVDHLAYDHALVGEYRRQLADEEERIVQRMFDTGLVAKGEKVTLPDGTVVEFKKGSQRIDFDDPSIHHDIVAAAASHPNPEQAAVAEYRKRASDKWSTTGLRDVGVDPDRYCNVEYGGLGVKSEMPEGDGLFRSTDDRETIGRIVRSLDRGPSVGKDELAAQVRGLQRLRDDLKVVERNYEKALVDKVPRGWEDESGNWHTHTHTVAGGTVEVRRESSRTGWQHTELWSQVMPAVTAETAGTPEERAERALEAISNVTGKPKWKKGSVGNRRFRELPGRVSAKVS